MKKALLLFCLFLSVIASLCGCAEKESRVEISGVIWEYRELSDKTLCIYPAYEKIGEHGRKFLSDLSGCVNIPAEINGVAVTRLDTRAFYGCSEIEEAVLPEGIKRIGKECFFGCVNLSKLNFPDSLEICGDHALTQTALNRITVGAEFKSFGNFEREPFFGCTELKEIIVSSDNKEYASRAGVLFTKNMETLLYYPPASTLASYTVPDTVKTITKGAFSQCSNLNSLTFPKSLKTVKDSFYLCENLAEIYVPKDRLEDYRENELYSKYEVKASIS